MGELGATHHLEQLAVQVRERANTRGTIDQGIGLAARQRDQLRNRVNAQPRWRDQQQRCLGNGPHRPQIFLQVKREMIETRIDRIGGRTGKQCVAIGCRMDHCLGRNAAARPRPVFNDNRLAEPLGNMIGDHSGQCVGAGARWKTHQNFQWLVGPSTLPQRAARAHAKDEAEETHQAATIKGMIHARLRRDHSVDHGTLRSERRLDARIAHPKSRRQGGTRQACWPNRS